MARRARKSEGEVPGGCSVDRLGCLFFFFFSRLVAQDARPLDRDDASDEDDAGPVAPDWEPASRDADPASGSRGGGDILSMLVSIYGSKVMWCDA